MREFFARIWLLGDDGIEVDTWANELIPTSGPVIPLAEWAKEVIEMSFDDKELRALFKLPAEGDYQTLCTGTIRHVASGYPADGGEDEVDLDLVQFAAVPAEYLELQRAYRLEDRTGSSSD